MYMSFDKHLYISCRYDIVTQFFRTITFFHIYIYIYIYIYARVCVCSCVLIYESLLGYDCTSDPSSGLGTISLEGALCNSLSKTS